MKVAIVSDWLETYSGAERVVEQLIQSWPEADIFALCDFLPDSERHFLGGRKVTTTFIQRLPGARKRFRWYLGFMPLAIEQLDLGAYDLVLSSSHAIAKGVLTGPAQLHISYVHSPMRYAWDLQTQYLEQAGLTRGIKGWFTRWLLHRMRHWDRSSAAGVDVIVANSSYIAQRIRKVWRRDATVIHPPVDVARFALRADKEDFYLTASRMVPYKRMELIAAAFRRMPDRKLVVLGDGPNRAQVEAAAGGAPNIEFRGRVDTAELVRLTQAARAAIFAAEEDFGIATVEAQACGTPVIAFGRGGVRDIVLPAPAPDATGLFFAEQSAAAIAAAVDSFESLSPAISAEACRANAMRFSREEFRRRIQALARDEMARAGLPLA